MLGRVYLCGFHVCPLPVTWASGTSAKNHAFKVNRQCHQFCLFANSKRADGVPQQHRTYRHWPAWKPVWLPHLQGQLVACVHGRGHVPILVHKRGQMVPSFVCLPPPWDTHIAEERDNTCRFPPHLRVLVRVDSVGAILPHTVPHAMRG